MLWVVQDIISQYIIGLILCAIIFVIWKLTHRGEKL